ncbi:MAG: hypothetical protein ACTHLE_17635, partial [Agriterribacter sp.]
CMRWSVRYSNDDEDVFTRLFELWNNIEYLTKFFRANQLLLQDPFWKNTTIDEAIDQVLDEAESFESELFDIKNLSANEQVEALGKIFKPLHKGLFEIRQRKGKPDFSVPMLRLYAIKLDDGSIVVTGGAIKLMKIMEGPMFELEKHNLKLVQQFLDSEGIFTSEGLNELD